MSAEAKPSIRDRFGAVHRRAIGIGAQEPVRFSPLAADGTAFLLAVPAVPGLDLAHWATSNRAHLDATLCRHGAIWFRGFGYASASDLDRLVQAVSGAAMAYEERSSPRRSVAGRVYSSTEYPADQRIFFHNENSYAHIWPGKLFFCCVHPPEIRGETPIADCRRVLDRIPPNVRERFARKGVMYIRNFGGGLGLDWREVFQTNDKAELAEKCRQGGYRIEWRDADRLRTTRVAQPGLIHPASGAPVWFNHAVFFHPSRLPPAIRETLERNFDPRDLPNYTCYGDGEPFEPEVLELLRTAYEAEAIYFPWERGDVLLLDNILVAHGRNSYSGPRQVVVAMSEPHSHNP